MRNLFVICALVIASQCAFSNAFQIPLLLRPSSSRLARAHSTSPKMAAMVSVTVQEKTGPKTFTCEKEEVLRTAMLQNNVELYYTMKGKLWNCNGGGNCGTCKVELVSGSVTPRTAAENKLLAGDPKNFRLACQTCVLGTVVVKNKPDA